MLIDRLHLWVRKVHYIGLNLCLNTQKQVYKSIRVRNAQMPLMIGYI